MRVSRSDIEAIYRQGPDAVVALVEALQDRIVLLEDQDAALRGQLDQVTRHTTALERRLRELEARLDQNSHNSSRPPSSDAWRRDPPTRKPSSKKQGGQPGHRGHTLEMVQTPNQVIEHAPACCAHCGTDLRACPQQALQRRQVFDLPPITVQVSEHRIVRKRCPHC